MKTSSNEHDDADDALAVHRMPGHLIRRLQQASVSIFVEEMLSAGFDLTPVQYAALFTIGEHPGLDQISLAGLIAYDRTTIGGVIDRLENKNFVRRTSSPRDRRVRLLHVTPDGEAMVAAATPIVERIQEAILDPLGPEERSVFMAILRKLVRANNERTRVPIRPVSRQKARR